MTSNAEILDAHCVQLIEKYSDYPLITFESGKVLSFADGYIPLLVNFTHEDKAAKGLRKLGDDTEPQPPVYFSALEVTRDTPALILLGERGSGKTSFAINLALYLSGDRLHSPVFNVSELNRSVPRNDIGSFKNEDWQGRAPTPIYIAAKGPSSFTDLLADTLPNFNWSENTENLLIILDEADKLGTSGPDILKQVIDFASLYQNIRPLVLGESTILKSWPTPTGFLKQGLLPLLQSQRAAFSEPQANWSNPGLFALSLRAPGPATSPEALIDQWLATVALGQELALTEAAFVALRDQTPILTPNPDQLTLNKTYVLELLAARHLATLPSTQASDLFHADPDRWTGPITSLARRLKGSGDSPKLLIHNLISGASDTTYRGALIAASLVSGSPELQSVLLSLIQTGALSPYFRQKAGQILARCGDPRDLQALASIPGGAFTMGSDTHPNSAPSHQVTVKPFKIGLYPVVNADYRQFIQVTNRPWKSPDGLQPERANAPSVDLTWHDARAYCDWLTARWRSEGRIQPDEQVRLPTEPEWERAARGDQKDQGETITYPWSGPWIDDAANSEEAGFNDTCTVGLFPKGRSPYGCYDMAGQVWEWTTTLWGSDMSTPSYQYPYTIDGRESPDAPPDIRRVLRGGCFSSGRLKANCTYRGSLEPNGFWRGNGFRIVVAAIG